MYTAKTREIRVSVQPTFLDEQSSPEDGHFVWAYHVRIENEGRETVQLLSRHWRITDALGRTQEVRGAGVVGEQMVAFVLADEVTRTFGGDTVDDMIAAVKRYRDRIAGRTRS